MYANVIKRLCGSMVSILLDPDRGQLIFYLENKSNIFRFVVEVTRFFFLNVNVSNSSHGNNHCDKVLQAFVRETS